MILVVSYPDEDHTQGVIRHLQSAGHAVTLLDLAEFPARATMSMRWDHGGGPVFVADGADGTKDLTDVRVAWWRRVRPFTVDPALTLPAMRGFALSETTQAVNGMLDALPCVWVNPRYADDAAHHKPYQWATAQAVGLRVPPTLVTNRPEEARAFIDDTGLGRTVFKAFIATLDAWRETRLVQREDLDHLDSVRYAPVIFQEYIPGVDLRITIIGDEMYAAEIDARGTSYPVDMRMVIGESTVRAVALPAPVEDALRRLMRRLGLVYGAVDMRRTPDDDYVFLEVNPAGQWLFVEQLTGLPITRTVAALLGRLDRELPAGVER